MTFPLLSFGGRRGYYKRDEFLCVNHVRQNKIQTNFFRGGVAHVWLYVINKIIIMMHMLKNWILMWWMKWLLVAWFTCMVSGYDAVTQNFETWIWCTSWNFSSPHRFHQPSETGATYDTFDDTLSIINLSLFYGAQDGIANHVKLGNTIEIWRDFFTTPDASC